MCKIGHIIVLTEDTWTSRNLIHMYHLVVVVFFYFLFPASGQMVRCKALAHCGLVLLSLWLCIQSVPISVDKTKVKPQEEELGPPESAVSCEQCYIQISHLNLSHIANYTK